MWKKNIFGMSRMDMGKGKGGKEVGRDINESSRREAVVAALRRQAVVKRKIEKIRSWKRGRKRIVIKRDGSEAELGTLPHKQHKNAKRVRKVGKLARDVSMTSHPTNFHFQYQFWP